MARLTNLLAAFTLLLAGCSGNPPQSSWEIHLVQGEHCPACDLFEDIREQRGIGDWIEPDIGGMPRRVPVRTVAPADVPDDDINAMGRLPYLTGDEARDLVAGDSLLVIVRHEGRLRAAGNIASSSDLARAKFPPAVMQPPGEEPYEKVTLQPRTYFQSYYRESWSLAHFLDLALDPGTAYPRSFSEAYEPSPAVERFNSSRKQYLHCRQRQSSRRQPVFHTAAHSRDPGRPDRSAGHGPRPDRGFLR